MKMKAAVVVSPKRIEIQEIEVPPLTPTQMLVQVVSCGLCHSELGRYLGKGTMWLGDSLNYPLRLGHEPAGIVEEVGSAVKSFKPGDKVTGVGFKRTFAEYAWTADSTSRKRWGRRSRSTPARWTSSKRSKRSPAGGCMTSVCGARRRPLSLACNRSTPRINLGVTRDVMVETAEAVGLALSFRAASARPPRGTAPGGWGRGRGGRPGRFENPLPLGT